MNLTGLGELRFILLFRLGKQIFAFSSFTKVQIFPGLVERLLITMQVLKKLVSLLVSKAMRIINDFILQSDQGSR